MSTSTWKWRLLRNIRSRFRTDPDRFLRRVSAIIHVGANTGQERELYEGHGLRVLWIEPIPSVYEILANNISAFPRQRALRALVTDRDDVEYQFHIASNQGASSSILDLSLHKDIWPEITYERTITLRSKTLPSLLREAGMNPFEYDALILDTQGSELLVLHGASSILSGFKFIKLEVPDFESYAGCAKVPEIAAYLSSRGFTELSRRKFAERQAGGAYYDITYARLI